MDDYSKEDLDALSAAENNYINQPSECLDSLSDDELDFMAEFNEQE